METRRTVRGTEADLESSFSDYKEVGGLMLPYSITQGIKGTDRHQAMTFDTIEVDIPIDDSRFTMPGTTAAPDSAKAAPPKDAKAAPKKGK
jgi:hypothetical protein